MSNKTTPDISATHSRSKQRANRRCLLLWALFVAIIILSAWSHRAIIPSYYYRAIIAEKVVPAVPQYQHQQQGPPLYTHDFAPIRSWGCQRRNETPFIYVHIGKAGGGHVRARIAASALNYEASIWDRAAKQKNNH